MKIAITSVGPSIDSFVSEKFGRCSYFILYDEQTKKTEAIVNSAENMDHGAGPKAAQILITNDAKIVLTGAVGGNAERVLSKAGIKIITELKENMKVGDAIEYYIAKKDKM